MKRLKEIPSLKGASLEEMRDILENELRYCRYQIVREIGLRMGLDAEKIIEENRT